jgi:copper(I)-binding protein
VAFRLTMIAAAVLLALAPGAARAAEQGGPRIDHAWARATPGSARIGAAYFTIESPVDDRLIGLSSPVAGKAELHTHIEADGLMRMQAVEGGLAVAAHQQVELKPGGLLHVMLIDLNQKLKAGDHFPLILSFEKAGRRDVTVKVEPLGAMGPSPDVEMKHNVMLGNPGPDTSKDKAMPIDTNRPTGRPGL